MKKTHITNKLTEMNVNIDDIVMGDFDVIGEYTAKKNRSPNSENYKKHGCFFRPNYERGIFMYYFVQKNNIQSVLEIGFGRGYSCFCMAKAMCDLGIDGEITTVDPNFNEEFLNQLYKIFPKEWFEKINFVKSTSEEYYNKNKNKRFDFIFIDGDHREEAVKLDWEYAKNSFEKAVLFDDYHLPDKEKEKDIDCASIIDNIDGYQKELIIGDRRLFVDDRKYTDDQILSGQVLLTR